MEISVKPIDFNSPSITTLNVPTSDYSLDNGLRFVIEMLNSKGVILDRQSLSMKLPNFIVDGKEVPAIPYLKAKILEYTKMQEIPTPTQVPAIALPNWEGVLEAIRGSELFGRIYMLSEKNVDIEVAYTTVSIALNSFHPKVDDLYFGLQRLQVTMGANLTSADVDTINRILKANNFDFQLKFTPPPPTPTPIATIKIL